MLRQGQQLLAKLIQEAQVTITLSAPDLVLAMTTLSQGLAVNQRLLGRAMPGQTTRKLLGTIFDQFILSPEKKIGS
jgi:hypothetical protein